jgi:hypothetical protein
MPKKQLDLFETYKDKFAPNKDAELSQIVIDLHDIARRVENSGNPDQIGYAIRGIADRLSEHSRGKNV